ncbi:hypothetical protein LIER_25309 [Lithospermum erythrorhizon]|uniref:Uncharacterized protein n=1 Tax=Lithospermum erythrorhizon TaxID=34254 RepID=A0AAV3R4A7_LITER
MNVLNCEDLQMLSKDFQEAMGDLNGVYYAPSAPSSPSASQTAPLCIDGPTQDTTTYYVNVVYAAYNILERRHLLKAPIDMNKHDSRWMLMGDFNALISGDERIVRNAPSSLSMAEFSQCLVDSQLYDDAFVRSKYTWTNGKLSQKDLTEFFDEKVKICESNIESSGLDSARMALQEAEAEHLRCLAIEDGYWSQKSGVKWLKEGDKSTTFYHSWVKQRTRKKAITDTLIDGEWITNPTKVVESIVDHFQTAFTSNING